MMIDREQAIETLVRACRWMDSMRHAGGWASGYSLDGTERYLWGTYPLPGGTFAMRPPATSEVVRAFLRAYRVTGNDELYAMAARGASSIADAQNESGGWGLHSGGVAASTNDDATSATACSVLIDLAQEVRPPWLMSSIRKALDWFIATQDMRGGWPMTPGRTDYQGAITLNDGAMSSIILLMLQAHAAFGDERYLKSALRGGMCLKGIQKGGWPLQCGQITLLPTWGRDYEVPGYSPKATQYAIMSMMHLFHYGLGWHWRASASEAVHWLEEVKLDDNLWALNYNRYGTPLYGDSAKPNVILNDYAEVSDSCKAHYAQQGNFPGASIHYASLADRKVPMSWWREGSPQWSRGGPEPVAAMDFPEAWIDADRITVAKFEKCSQSIINWLMRPVEEKK